MESDLILSAQPAYPEQDDCAAEEPYLEAKLYIERVEKENNHKDRTHDPLVTDGPEPLEHGVSITMFPVRVPSMQISCATVQWDMPQTSADAPSQDTGSNEISLSYGLSMDWVVNPASLDVALLSQEDIIDLVPDKESGQTDDDLQDGPAISLEIDSSQVCILAINLDRTFNFTFNGVITSNKHF